MIKYFYSNNRKSKKGKYMNNEEKKLLSIYQKLSPAQKDTIWTLMEKWESEIEIKEEAEREA